MPMNRAYLNKPPLQTPCAATVFKTNPRSPSPREETRTGCRLQLRPNPTIAGTNTSPRLCCRDDD